jgi:DNA repair protein RecN (Recombination protein N)
MIHELDIENYAVVAKLRVGFRRGLNLLTGETGSGKSIVVDAVSLLFGARADAEAVRAGAERARISGVFEAADSAGVARLLAESGADADEAEIIVERHVLAGGKSRAYVNGRPATAALLRELAERLGDIHGQHEQQNLFTPAYQLAALDQFAGSGDLVERAGARFAEWRAAKKALAELRSNERERQRLLDLYRFQHEELSAAGLRVGEDEELEAERRRLRNFVRLREAAASAADALYDSPDSASAQLKAALRAVEELGALEPRFAELPGQLAAARATVEDAGFELQRYLGGLEDDPERLDRVEERLALIEKLKRKYGKTLAEVAAYADEVAAKLADLDDVEAGAAKLEKRTAQAAAGYREAAAGLSSGRQEAARRLAGSVEGELAALALERARFVVAVEPSADDEAGWTAEGWDCVRFDFSANPGQPPRPLAQTASGGELSRVALALKTCLLAEEGKTAAAPVPRTLVFDEIDTGVGGRVAEAIGLRLKRLAEANQVLCVTHLPQIAGFADAHYIVSKLERDGQTYAALAELAGEARVEELARMLSGAKVSREAIANARQLLAAAGRVP